MRDKKKETRHLSGKKRSMVIDALRHAAAMYRNTAAELRKAPIVVPASASDDIITQLLAKAGEAEQLRKEMDSSSELLIVVEVL